MRLPEKKIHRAILRPSPRRTKKWRVELHGEGHKSHIDFGQSGASDFTRHNDAARMLRYIIRHGATLAGSEAWLIRYANDTRLDPLKKEFNQKLYRRVILAALNITKSSREDWSDVTTPGFWSRWLTWSHPDIDDAMRFIKRKFIADVRRQEV